MPSEPDDDMIESAENASTLAKRAAKKADEIFNKAKLNAEIASIASPIVRKAVESFKNLVERLGEIREALKKFPDSADDKAHESGFVNLAEQLQMVVAFTKREVQELRQLGEMKSIESDIRKAEEELKTPEGDQETEEVDTPNGSIETSDPAEEESSTHEANEKQKLSRVAKRVADEMKKAGLPKVIRAIEKATTTLEIAENAARKGFDGTQSIKDITRDPIRSLKNVIAMLNEAFDAPQVRLKSPTYKIWESAFKGIAIQAKIASEQASLAENIYRQTQSPKDKEFTDSAVEYKKEVERLEESVRKNYEGALTAEALLNIVAFFDDYKEQIYDRLEACSKIADKAITNGNTLFIAESLPIINGIIHVGSTREELNSATKWVRDNWEAKEAHPRIVLSALLFKYVTDRGLIDHRAPTDPKKEIWDGIENRVKNLF